MKIKIIPCICTKSKPSDGSVYFGMPQLKVTSSIKEKQYYEPFCPICGRGGFQYESSYLALKHWNEIQRELWLWEN